MPPIWRLPGLLAGMRELLAKPSAAPGVNRESGGVMARAGSPLRAIREKCLDCTCQQPVEVRECRIQTCALWPFRMGKDVRLQGRKNAGSFKPKGGPA